MTRKSSLTKRQLALHPAHYEQEASRLRYDARVAYLDGRVAHANKYNRQADELEARLRAAEKAA